MHSCSASSGKPNSNSLECIVFSRFVVYLQYLDIHRYRWLFCNRCICNSLISAVADDFFVTDVSALPRYSLLQMLFLGPTYLQLAFLGTCRYFSACLLYTITSTSCLFLDLRILLIEILHPQFALSITCRFRAEIVHPQRLSSKVLLFNSSSMR